MRFSTQRKIDALVVATLMGRSGHGAEVASVAEQIAPRVMAAFPAEIPDATALVAAVNASFERLCERGLLKRTPPEQLPIRRVPLTLDVKEDGGIA